MNTAALYKELVATWLDRDQGKHQLPPRHKIRLMGDLAAQLWREGRRSLPVDRLEAWLEARLDSDDELGRWFRLKRADLGVVAEDLRTATFVVRPEAEDFQFAHTSLLEYFLALHLAGALADGGSDAWALPMISPETLDFLGEIIEGADVEACKRGLRGLRAPYRAQASELAFTYCVRALERGAPAIALAGFALEGAKLRGIAITGPPGGPMLPLTDCTLAGADLREACLRRVRVECCDLSGARLVRAELHDGVLDRVDLDGADMTETIVRGCRLASLDVSAARAHRTQWLGCTGDGPRWPRSGETHSWRARRSRGTCHPSRRNTRQCQDLLRPQRLGAQRRMVTRQQPPRQRRRRPQRADRDPATGEQLQHLTGHTGWVRSVAWSPDNSRLASAGDDRSVRIWDPANGEHLRHLRGHTDMVSGVAWSADAPASPAPATTACGSGIPRPAHICTTSPATHTGRTSRGRRTAPASPAPTRTAQWRSGTPRPASSYSTSPATPAGCAASHGQPTTAASPARLRRSEDLGRRDRRTPSPPHRAHARGNQRRVVSCSSRLASAGYDGARIWDAATGEHVHHLTGHTGWVRSVAWSADSTRLASAGDDRSVRIWDAATGEPVLAVHLFDDEHAVLVDGRVASCSAGAWRWLG